MGIDMDLIKPVTIRSVDNIYPLIGDGWYQFVIIAVGCLGTLPLAMQEFIIFFLAFNPGWTCRTDSTVCNLNRTKISSTDIEYKARCHMNRSEWSYIAPEKFSVVTEFDLSCKRESWIYMSSTVFYMGNLIGALVLGWASDRFGRSKIILSSSCMVIFTSFVTTWAPNLVVFEILRFISGLFVPGTYMVVVVLASEIVSEKFRSPASIIFWFFYALAVALLGVIAFHIQVWRRLLLFSSAPYFILIASLWIMPESFVWLHAQGKKKEKELLQNIRKIAHYNRREMPVNIQFLWTEENEEKEDTTIFLLFTPWRVLLKTLPLSLSWFSLGLLYFGISLAADDLTGDAYRDFALLAIVEMPACVAAIYCSIRFGRKGTVIATIFFGGLSIFVVGFIPLSKSRNSVFSILRLFFGIGGKFFASVTFDTIITWCAELYPTKLRSMANGYFNAVSIVGSMSSPWLGVWLRQVHYKAPYLTMGGCAIISSIFLARLSETRGQSLPQRIQSNRVHEIDNELSEVTEFAEI